MTCTRQRSPLGCRQSSPAWDKHRSLIWCGLRLRTRTSPGTTFIGMKKAARRTIIQPVLAEADVNLTLAQAAIIFALALLLGQLALHAAVFSFGGSGGHEQNVDPRLARAKCRR